MPLQHNAPPTSLEQTLFAAQATIETWFEQKWQETPAPFYGSVDLRQAGFKLAPVDTNLFPAGFNNMHADALPRCIEAAKNKLAELGYPQARILLIPESHTRNQYYYENVATLKQILEQAGATVRIGSLLDSVKAATSLELSSHRTLTLEPLKRNAQDQLGVDNFIADIVLLNNDLTDGIPPILENITQPLIPPLHLGWFTRLKSTHFQQYADVCQEFGELLTLDPWLIAPYFGFCGEVDFMAHEGETCLVNNVRWLLEKITKKYKEYQLEQKPFVIVKADAGTYGMAVMTVHSPEDIQRLNRKQRTRMSTIKGGQPVTRVIIQEGVYTTETWGETQDVAEPVVYMIGKRVIGGFYRVNPERDVNENLNAPGMRFHPWPNHECDAPRCYAYGVIARLALLAAAREVKQDD